MTKDTAYRSATPEVIEAWRKFEADSDKVQNERRLLVEEYGRNVMVNRSGFGHGTRVVGFCMLPADERGTYLFDRSVYVPKTGNTVVPNRRNRVGKELQQRLSALTSPDIDLPGMPDFHLYSDEGIGLRSCSPGIWFWDGVLYAFWPTDTAPVGDEWETVPLSTYYLAKEQHDAAH